MSAAKYTLVLMRHAHSEWNLTDRFTGWSDISLTDIGLEESASAGKRLRKASFEFDEAHISVLRRNRQTLDTLLAAAKHPAIPIYSTWRLNERHYGQLQGMNKKEIFASWGEENARKWWRGFTEPPPPLELNDPRHPRFDLLYQDLEHELLPASESLEQCMNRLIPYWEETLTPRIRSGKRLLVISHGNTLRGLRMHVENINPNEIEHVEIPSAVPMVYKLNKDMNVLEIDWLE